MSVQPPNQPDDVKPPSAPPAMAQPPVATAPPAALPAAPPDKRPTATIATITPIVPDPRASELLDMPQAELRALAEDFGLPPGRYKTKQHLAAAVADRRQLVASLDPEAMLDVVRWGRRPVPVGAPREQLALEIARIRSMKFDGLSHRGLVVLALLRDVECTGDETSAQLVKRLKSNEGFFARMNRK